MTTDRNEPTILSSLPTAELDAAADFLDGGDDYLVTAHVNSDGDAIGGCLALANLLRLRGKSCRVVLNDVPPGNAYDFLQGAKEIEIAREPAAFACATGVVLDCPTLERTGLAASYLEPQAPVLNLDHHHDNARFGVVNLVSDDVSSTCELVYHLAAHMGVDYDRGLAEQLYTGILYDTGGFRYSLTTPTSLEVAADLIRHGARLDFVADAIYNNNSFESVKVIGNAIDSLRLHKGGQVATLHLSVDDINRGDPEATVNYGLMIRGVEVTALFKEEKPGEFRISLRSRRDVDVSGIAHQFDGGGHARAAGCRLQGSFAEVQQQVLHVIAATLR